MEHQYKPVIGSAYGGFDASMADQDTERDMCLDDITKRAIQNRIKARMALARPTSLTFSDVEYILGTGRNWEGPIGKFTLRIRKETPDELVSLCFPGKPTKISPTVLEFHQKDFVPPDRLVVYFYKFVPD